jgi:hypothetical protein
MQSYKIMASSMTATYTAGTFCADNAAEACEMARVNYRNSQLGRTLKDCGAFRFYTVSQFPYEQANEVCS